MHIYNDVRLDFYLNRLQKKKNKKNYKWIRHCVLEVSNFKSHHKTRYVISKEKSIRRISISYTIFEAFVCLLDACYLGVTVYDFLVLKQDIMGLGFLNLKVLILNE